MADFLVLRTWKGALPSATPGASGVVTLQAGKILPDGQYDIPRLLAAGLRAVVINPALQALLEQDDGGLHSVVAATVTNLYNRMAQFSAWFPPDYNNNEGNYRVRGITVTAQQRFTWRVPNNFSELTKLVLVGQGELTEAGPITIDFTTSFAANLQDINTNTGFQVVTGLSLIADEFFELDLSGAYDTSLLRPGDTCGIIVDHVSGFAGTVNYFGVLLEYST